MDVVEGVVEEAVAAEAEVVDMVHTVVAVAAVVTEAVETAAMVAVVVAAAVGKPLYRLEPLTRLICRSY